LTSKQILDTPSAPSALGPYSVAVETHGLVFVSGQVAFDPDTGERVPEDIDSQARRVLDNIGLILSDVGLDYTDVVKTTIFLADIGDYPTVNEIYASYFRDRPPARSAFQAGALPGGFLIEIEVVAARRTTEEQ
jgi:2-iminobutanoate/2-iminopropanoate deaminase